MAMDAVINCNLSEKNFEKLFTCPTEPDITSCGGFVSLLTIAKSDLGLHLEFLMVEVK